MFIDCIYYLHFNQFYNMLKSFFKFVAGYITFINIIITTANFYTTLVDTSITKETLIRKENKRYDYRCSIYCDKHGCTHKHQLQKYHWIFQKYDFPLTNFPDYRDINLLFYLLLIPFLIYLALYLK